MSYAVPLDPAFRASADDSEVIFAAMPYFESSQFITYCRQGPTRTDEVIDIAKTPFGNFQMDKQGRDPIANRAAAIK